MDSSPDFQRELLKKISSSFDLIDFWRNSSYYSGISSNLLFYLEFYFHFESFLIDQLIGVFS